MTGKTLAWFLPHEFLCGGEYIETAAYKLRDVAVNVVYASRIKRWPGPQKNVSVWYALANGKAVGWNENPRLGWTFPVIPYNDPLLSGPILTDEVVDTINEREGGKS